MGCPKYDQFGASLAGRTREAALSCASTIGAPKEEGFDQGAVFKDLISWFSCFHGSLYSLHTRGIVKEKRIYKGRL